MPQMTAYFLPQRQKGGCDTISAQGVSNATFLYLTNYIVVIHYYSAPRVPNGRKRRGS